MIADVERAEQRPDATLLSVLDQGVAAVVEALRVRGDSERALLLAEMLVAMTGEASDADLAFSSIEEAN